MLMLDICAGLGGASQAMRERGWMVVTLDNDPRFCPDVVADVRTWSWSGARPDLVWCSPPCVEFSRESMPWCRTGNVPDMSLVNACKRIISECQPRYWVIENVRGAVPYLGKPSVNVGPFYLWGSFPDLGRSPMSAFRKKESYTSGRRAERAKVPRSVSWALSVAIESQVSLWYGGVGT